jgi:hypothetical protein
MGSGLALLPFSHMGSGLGLLHGIIWGQALGYCIFDLETNRIFDKNATMQGLTLY